MHTTFLSIAPSIATVGDRTSLQNSEHEFQKDPEQGSKWMNMSTNICADIHTCIHMVAEPVVAELVVERLVCIISKYMSIYICIYIYILNII